MKNNKWNTKSVDDRDMYVVLFVARNKDNKHIEDFKERRRSFITKETLDSDRLINDFNDFVNAGVSGEVCRMYYSINARNEDKVYKDLIHFLIDTPDFNLCSINSKLAGIAAINSNAKTKHWMFDFDIDDETKVSEFVADIKTIDADVDVIVHKTPHGYAVITQHGFDTRELYKKWDPNEVSLKRDDLLCARWKTKE